MAYQFEFKVLDNISPVLNTLAGSFVKIQQDAQKFNATTTKMPIVEQIEKIKSFSEKLPIVEQLNKISAAPTKMPIMEQIEKIKSFSEKLPITDEIDKINKISANTGISILELKEKLQSLQGGDFSKFKEIGVNMSKVPNQQLLEVDYKGNKQAISPNVGAVTDYILSLGDLQNTANTTSKSIFSTFETLTSNLNQAKYNVTSAYSTFKTNIIGNLLELSPAFASFYEQNETSLTQFENKVLGLTAYFDTFISTMDTIRNVKGAYTDIINSFTLLKTTGIETFTALKGNIVTSITRMATFGLTSLTAIGTYISTLITATAAQYGFNLAISLNPIGLAVAAILAIGVAVYELVTHWETVKAWINNFSKWVWEHHPFKFVFDLIDKVFPQFKVALNGIWDYTKGLFDKLWNWFAEKLQWIKDMISGFTSSPIEIKATANVSNLITDVTQQAYDLLHSKDLATGTDKGLGIQNKLDKESVKGNDKKIVNVSIKIDKLNEGGINIITNNFRESEGQLKAFFERMLLDAVNQANYAY